MPLSVGLEPRLWEPVLTGDGCVEASPLWTALSISGWVWAVVTFFHGFCLWVPALASLDDAPWPGSLRQLNSPRFSSQQRKVNPNTCQVSLVKAAGHWSHVSWGISSRGFSTNVYKVHPVCKHDVCPLHTDKKVPVCLCRVDSFCRGPSCSSKPRFCSWNSLLHRFDFQNQASCHISVNQALEKLRQDNLEFRTNLGYIGKVNMGQYETLFQKQRESDSRSQQALAYRARQEPATLHLHTVNKVWIITSQKGITNSSLSSWEGRWVFATD